MSILYDYLKVLEKKGARQEAGPQAAIQPKKGLNLRPYLVTGLLLIFSALTLLLFFRNTNIPIRQPVKEKTVVSRQVLNPVSRETAGTGGDNASISDLSIKGIIYSADSPSAIINGKLVEKDAMIGDWQVVDISPSEVKLENSKNSSLLTLKLNSPLEK